jgi:hypothetical protein
VTRLAGKLPPRRAQADRRHYVFVYRCGCPFGLVEEGTFCKSEDDAWDAIYDAEVPARRCVVKTSAVRLVATAIACALTVVCAWYAAVYAIAASPHGPEAGPPMSGPLHVLRSGPARAEEARRVPSQQPVRRGRWSCATCRACGASRGHRESGLRHGGVDQQRHLPVLRNPMKVVRKNTAKGHYYLDADTGERVPGVTTIVGDGMPKPALLNWAGEATAEYAVDNWDVLGPLPLTERLKKIKGGRYEKRDAAANKGSAVHAMAERLITGEKVTVPDELAGYVESCVRFLDDFDVRQEHVEVVVYSETHRYVGTTDLIARVLLPDMPEYEHIPRDADGYSLGLFDWKTSKSGIFGDVALQLVAYRHAEHLIADDGEVVEMPWVDFTAGIHLRADGYSFVPLETGDDVYRDFLYVKEVARVVRGLRDLVGDFIVPPTASQYVLAKAANEEVPY